VLRRRHVVGAGPAATALAPGKSLGKGASLLSPNRRAVLRLRPDGMLELGDTQAKRVLWVSPSAAGAIARMTGRGPGTHADMQADGNFVLYDARKNALWGTGTSGHPGAHLALQDDGNLVVYDKSGRALWGLGTEGFKVPPSGGGPLADLGKLGQALASAYNAIPLPVRAALVPATAITEYAYSHPESIPMFGKQAAQAKALFEGLQKGNLDPASAANIASQAIGPNLHLPPEVSSGITAAAHMAAAASPLASQAMQIAQSSGAAAIVSQVPHPATLAAAPPPPAHPAIHLQLAHAAAAGAPPPPLQPLAPIPATAPAPSAAKPPARVVRLKPPAPTQFVARPHPHGIEVTWL